MRRTPPGNAMSAHNAATLPGEAVGEASTCPATGDSAARSALTATAAPAAGLECASRAWVPWSLQPAFFAAACMSAYAGPLA